MAKQEKPQYSPLMMQYLEVQEQTPGCLVLFRLGDFYECFFDDAKVVSKELDLVLTGRDCGQAERAPMCGVPFHAVEGYLQRLVQKGYKVAVCEQVEDPKLAVGLVKREVTRIVTPGTNINAEPADEKESAYIMALTRVGDTVGYAYCDISTGEFCTAELSADKLIDEMAKICPTEIVINEDCLEAFDVNAFIKLFSSFITPMPALHFRAEHAAQTLKNHFHVYSIEGLGLTDLPLATGVSGALLDYFNDTQKRDMTHISAISLVALNRYMRLDASTRRNLELTETLRDKSRVGSLLWVLDDTKTAMGGRLLRKYVEQPLTDSDRIRDRLDGVECFVRDPMLAEEAKELLNGIYDMERLMGRISYGSANARDLLALKQSIRLLPELRQLTAMLRAPYFVRMTEDFDALEDLHALLEQAIHDEAPISLREGRLIKDGYSAQVDALRTADTDGKKWLVDLEAREKEKTGIRTLRIGYNRVFGYYLEVSNSFKDQVPPTYIRKQTLANGERYITEELKQMEDTILGAKERLIGLEYDLFLAVREKIASQMARVQKTAQFIAKLDVIRSLAAVAVKNNYVKPEITDDPTLDIFEGRHPVVEKMLSEAFIPNDASLDTANRQMMIITGPNMAGKSTYMRQVAMITLMAQIGSYVPAKEARVGVVDRIFTRVGASDNLAGGQSTFMVEMAEMSNILRHATKNSLLILDEIGRGTSTYDGLSIAWAVVEYICQSIGAKTLFATHYHELTELEGHFDGVMNYCIAIKETANGILFLRKVVPGFGSRSYGIEVARLAGLPEAVVARSQEILVDLLKTNIHQSKDEQEGPMSSVTRRETEQMCLFAASNPAQDALVQKIKDLHVNDLTPIGALETLDEIVRQAQQL